MNRLATETSPYLLQHAANPVDWYPWGEEALARARAEDRPILLSIGYAACHWCHVMERESFEDPLTARVMNDHFVSVKVDREERPDVDSIYMDAVVALTGSGGWPMTVFLTPGGEPFFGGTYFPPEPRHGLPSFKQVLLGVAEAWEERRDEVERSGRDLTEHIRSSAYLRAARRFEHEPYRVIAERTIDYVLRELALEGGGYASAQDADTDGVEGLTFTWAPGEGAPEELLQPFEDGRFVLRGDLDDEVRTRLLAQRAERPQPLRDDKAIASWNGLMLAALAQGGRVEPAV